MSRFYLPPERCQNSILSLDEREVHHGLHVLRLREGDQVSVLDGAGHEYHCFVARVAKSSVELSVERKTFAPPSNCVVTLAQAVLKGKAFEFLVQKATELGVSRLVPLLCERVIVQVDGHEEDKREKWRQVAIEAMKQCGNPWLPRLEVPVRLRDFLSRRDAWDLSLVASLQPGSVRPQELLRPLTPKAVQGSVSICVYIGPEGDFAPDEIDLITQSGAVPVTLGRLVLRAETAALCALSILNYELGLAQAQGATGVKSCHLDKSE